MLRLLITDNVVITGVANESAKIEPGVGVTVISGATPLELFEYIKNNDTKITQEAIEEILPYITDLEISLTDII